MSEFVYPFAIVLFWLCLATLFYAYAGYPILLAIIALFRNRPRANLGYFPTISVLIAAYNEESSIRNKIEQTLSLDYPADKLEILVLSDCSTDRTDEIVKSLSTPRVRLLRTPQRIGKTGVQNLGVEEAQGEILIFSDATTTYHPLALQYLAANFSAPTVGAAGGRFQYFDQNGSSPTGVGMVAFWSYETIIKILQSRISTVTGCSGCIYAVRRTVYTPLHPSIISDLVQPLCVVRKGYRVVFEDRAMAYEETTRSAREEFAMRVRVVTRGIRGFLSVSELFNLFQYPWISFQIFSHKITRWLVPFLLPALFFATLLLQHYWAYHLLFIAQLVFYSVALSAFVLPLHRVWKPLTIPLYFCTINIAVFWSVVEVLRGRKYVVWQTVRTPTKRDPVVS
jgi:cellulose synthase/poly-beta-1,6-N-acetylglucosamine synthase-like glycosyltransferase